VAWHNVGTIEQLEALNQPRKETAMSFDATPFAARRARLIASLQQAGAAWPSSRPRPR
jgi:hypothetical protein